ncbi:MAG: PAS domain-containing protein [Nanoarchaeota archaeon]|nr:PAS domain-containing protein [Nanoarchaeota archaeon]
MLKNFDDCINLFSDDESQMTEQEKAALRVGCMKVLNVISNPTIILNNDFDIMFANKAFLKCIDKSTDSVIGEKCFDVFDCCGVKEQNGACPFSDSIKEKKSKKIEFCQHNSGKYWEMIVDPCIHNKNVVACIHFFREITSRKLKEQKIIDEFDDLSEDMEKISDLMEHREIRMAELKDKIHELEKERI